MRKLNIPPLKMIPEGANNHVRASMFDDYKRELIRMNPGCFNDDGTVKTVYQKITELFTHNA